MSEKRLIDWNEFKRHCPDNICNAYHGGLSCRPKTCKHWQALPKPTLPDVTGTRTLDSMTEEEIKELVELYAGNYIEIEIVQRSENDIYVEYADHKQRKTLHIYLGELSVAGKEIKIFKWFIKNGFNVLGDI